MFEFNTFTRGFPDAMMSNGPYTVVELGPAEWNLFPVAADKWVYRSIWEWKSRNWTAGNEKIYA